MKILGDKEQRVYNSFNTKVVDFYIEIYTIRNIFSAEFK